jgi:ribonuclease HII
VLYYERKLKKEGFNFIVGVDEAGRGPLAGPVVAGAACLKTFRFRNRIDDSKKLSAREREEAFLELIEKSIFGIGIVEQALIDRLNILEATRLSMQRAITCLVEKLNPAFNLKRLHLLVDGNLTLNITFPYTCVIKGDAKSKSIAAASILAKVTRDNLMYIYDRVFPQYNFARHKGYPTKEHRRILKKIGPSLIHRKSFCCV